MWSWGGLRALSSAVQLHREDGGALFCEPDVPVLRLEMQRNQLLPAPPCAPVSCDTYD